MSDDEINRREFLGGKKAADEGGEQSDKNGWKPGWQPAAADDVQRNRRDIRQQFGGLEEPEEEPFDALDFLAGLDEGENETDPNQTLDSNPPSRHATIPVHRPPRALPEEEFLQACTRCKACIEACPHDAIALAGQRFRGAEGTPVIDASKSPCLMCEDTPCVSACEPDALRHSLGLSMGDAQIQRHDCIAHQGGFCSTCSERCPVPGAIKVRQGKPTIRQAACTGCGVCHYVCPAPRNAVRIFPRGIPE